MKIAAAAVALLALGACDKYGPGGGISRVLGNWVEVRLPAGCDPQQIAAEESGGVAVLCKDGRVFH